MAEPMEIDDCVPSSSTSSLQNYPHVIQNYKPPDTNKHYIIDDIDKRYCGEKECKAIKVATQNDLADILQKFSSFSFANFPKWFVLIIEADNFGFNGSISRQIQTNISKLKEILIDGVPSRPMLIQLVSKTENIRKIFYKEDVSNFFFEISESERFSNLKNFSSFFFKFINGDISSHDESLLKYQESATILRFLRMFEFPEETFVQLKTLCVQKGSVEQFLAAFDVPFGTCGKKLDSDAKSLLIHTLLTSYSRTTVFIAAHFIKELTFNDQILISTTAYLNANFQYLCDLLSIADFPFPNNFDKDAISDQRLMEIAQKRLDFQNAIDAENLANVNNFVDKNRNLKIVYSFDNTSMLEHAVKHNKIRLYCYLKHELGFKEAPNYDFTNLFRAYGDEITTLNVNNSRPEERSIILLAAKSLIYNRGITKEEETNYRQIIRKWYDDINRTIFGSQLINAVAQCEELKIIFDFDCNLVNEADKIADRELLGSTHLHKKWIFIGAKIENNQEEQIKGIIAHELCHYALKLVFENNSRPYNESYNKVSSLFDKIAKEIEIFLNPIDDGCFGIIYGAFKIYPAEVRHQELIVTVAQNLARFHGKYDKLGELQLIYKYLFLFYKIFVVPALENFKLSQRICVRKFNRIVGVLQKTFNMPFSLSTWIPLSCHFKRGHVIISTNVPALLLRNIYHCLLEAHKNLCDAKTIFVAPKALKTEAICKDLQKTLEENSNLTSFDETQLIKIFEEAIQNSSFTILSTIQILSSYAMTQDICPNLYVIVDCSKESGENLERFTEILKIQNINFIFVARNENQEVFNILEQKLKLKEKASIDYVWSALDTPSRNALLQKRVSFQKNSNVLLNELLIKPTNINVPTTSSLVDQQQEDFGDIIDSHLLNSLIEGKQISINEAFDQELKADKFFFSIFKPRSFIKSTKEKETTLTMNEYKTFKKTGNFKIADKKEGDKNQSGKDKETVQVVERFVEKQPISLEDQLSEVKDQKFVLISDIAGAGKSWMLKNVKNILHSMYPDRWLTYVDLKQFIDAFNSHIGDFNFVNFMVESILGNGTNYEGNFFKKLYENGRAFILFDGFDEISPDCADKVTNLLQTFEYKGGNQLWITTRDYFEVDLQEKLQISVAYQLDEFTEDNGVDIIASKWVLHDLEKQKNCSEFHYKSEKEIRKIIEESPNYKTFQSYALNLIRKIPKAEFSKIGYPQFYRIVTDIFENNKTGTIEFTLYKIYKSYGLKQCKLWSHEQGEIREQASIKLQQEETTFWELHQYHAMRNLFPNISNYCDLEKDTIGWPNVHIIGCGFLSKRGDNFVYSHETFCEYFAAEFILRILRKGLWRKNEDFFKLFVDLMTIKKFNVVRTFIDEGFVENSVFAKLKMTVENFAEKFFGIVRESEQFHAMFAESLESLVKFFILILEKSDYEKTKNVLLKNTENIIDVCMDSEIYRTFQDFFVKYLQKNDLKDLIKNCNIFHAIARSSLDSGVAVDLADKVKEKIGKKFLQQRLKSKISGYNLLVFIIFSNNFVNQKFVKLFTILVNYLEKDDIWKMICTKNILKLVVSRNDEKILETVWRTVKKFSVEQMPEKKFTELLSPDKNNKNRTLLFNAVFRNNIKFHKTLWNLLSTTFENKEELKKFALKKDTKGNNFVHLLVAYGEPSTVAVTFEMLQKYLDSSQYKEILTSKGFEHRNILQKAADRSKNIKVHRVLWKIVRESFETEGEFLEIIGERDGYSCNAIFVTANFCSSEVFEFMIQEIEKIATFDEIRNLLNQKTSFGRNLLQSALSLNKSLDMHRRLWKVIRQYFEHEEIVEFIRERDNTRRNLREIADEFSTQEIIKLTNENIRLYIN